MAHERYPEIGKLTLEGRHSEAIALALSAFHKNQEGALVMCASTFYSARKAVPDMVYDHFGKFVYPLVGHVSAAFDSKNADALDVISTVLVWWGYDAKAKQRDELVARQAAWEAVGLGLELTEAEPDTEHTRTLLLLTWTDLLFRTHNYREGVRRLKEASNRAFGIEDPNQKSRAFRKSCYLFFRAGHFKTSLAFYLYARGVAGIVPDVQRKNSPF